MADYIWVLSNRVDDRVVLWERDEAHPGGELLVGGAAPVPAGKTPEVERLLRAGLLIEVSEPSNENGPKLALYDTAVAGESAPDLPGQEVRLGRKADPALFSASEARSIEKKQESLPDELPVAAGTVIPPDEGSDRPTRRSR